jgi:hypothetical protein
LSCFFILTYKTTTYIIQIDFIFLLQKQKHNEICSNNYAIAVSAIALNWVAFNELLVIITCSTLSTLNGRGGSDMEGM